MSISDTESLDLISDSDSCKSSKRKKRGIIYLSSLPRNMTVIRLRKIMENFGEVGRIFLQPQKSLPNKKKPVKHFTEGWIEFEKKRVAKEVANGLNNRKLEARKKSELYDYIWSVKYLPRFKWVHLSERLAYERAVRKHRMRIEISQAKKEAIDFSEKVDLSEKLKNKNNSKSNLTSSILPPQKKTEEEFIKSKNEKQNKADNTDLLKNLFS